MRKIIVIPARLASTRLPNKLMLPYKGKEIIRHVLENALSAKANYVFLASDDDDILDCANGYSASCFPIKTGDCKNGTQRVAEALRFFGLKDGDLIVNMQGDSPQLTGEYVDELFDILATKQEPIATFAKKSTRFHNPNAVKVVLNGSNNAMYFSRSHVPYGADVCLEHIGIYGFKKSFFDAYDKIMNVTFGQENLEQLAWLHHRFDIHVSVVNYEGISVDTKDDYDALCLT